MRKKRIPSFFKYCFFCLLSVVICLFSASCNEQQSNQLDAIDNTSITISQTDESSQASDPNETSGTVSDNTTSTAMQPESKPEVPSEASASSEETDTVSNKVSFDENGNVVLSDPPTYEEILALHAQDPATYRDPGELQPETQEMIQLENGQWYQSFVYSSFNCRCVFLSNHEFTMHANWDFIAIGSAENAFLYNAGVMYDDTSSSTPYVERAIAVRGALTEGPDGYAYQLTLPDELIVCLEKPTAATEWNGNCYITETETLAVPELYASLFDGGTSEVIVTGIVMQDEKGIFYLKNVTLFG